MENNGVNRKKRRTIVAVVAVSSIAVVLFLCIFSLYHLPERDPVEAPVVEANATPVASPAEDFGETNDIMSASQEQASGMIGDLEMQYENAKLNNAEPYAAEQAGMRLALAYWKAGDVKQARDFTNSLIQNYSYDSTFVSRCNQLLETFK